MGRLRMLFLYEGVKSVVALVGLIAVIVAVLQYRTNTKWKKSEFLANEMKHFFEKKYTIEVLKFLDYSGHAAHFNFIGKEYLVYVHHSNARQQYFASNKLTESNKIFTIVEKSELIKEDVLLSDALSADIDKIFTPGQQYVRDSLDNYFGHFSRICVFNKNGLFEQDEFMPFIKYHLDLMNGKRTHSAGYQTGLFEYLSEYGYNDLLEMLEENKHKVPPPSKAIKFDIVVRRR